MPQKSIFFILLFVSLDQLTKYMVDYAFLIGSTLEILPFFNIIYRMNTGIAFSFFEGHNTFFIVLNIAIMTIMFAWYVWKRESLPVILKSSLVLILSGAIGNLLDRIFRGHVVDFLDFYFRDYHFPAFNLADSFISLGAILLIVAMLFTKKKA